MSAVGSFNPAIRGPATSTPVPGQTGVSPQPQLPTAGTPNLQTRTSNNMSMAPRASLPLPGRPSFPAMPMPTAMPTTPAMAHMQSTSLPQGLPPNGGLAMPAMPMPMPMPNLPASPSPLAQTMGQEMLATMAANSELANHFGNLSLQTSQQTMLNQMALGHEAALMHQTVTLNQANATAFKKIGNAIKDLAG